MSSKKLSLNEYLVLAIPLGKEKSESLLDKTREIEFCIDTEQLNRIVNSPTNYSGVYEKMRKFVIGTMGHKLPVKYIVTDLKTRETLCTKHAHIDCSETEVIKYLIDTMTSHAILNNRQYV